MIDLIVDSREKYVKGHLTDNGTPYRTEQLDVGDFLFMNGNQCLLVIERKTPADMYSSIVSKRFSEQRERIKKMSCLKMYIMEGLPATVTANSPKRDVATFKCVNGALENLALYHNIQILPTQDAKCTAIALANILKKLSENSQVHAKQTTDQLDTMIKKKDKVMENIFKHQLMLLPNVSERVADVITSQFAHSADMVTTLAKMNGSKSRIKFLSEISVGKKRLGKVLAERIIDVYMTTSSEDAQENLVI